MRAFFAQVKAIGWDSFRNCISAPPDFWYDLCDEMGLLIQDEYPYWGRQIDYVVGKRSAERTKNPSAYPAGIRRRPRRLWSAFRALSSGTGSRAQLPSPLLGVVGKFAVERGEVDLERVGGFRLIAAGRDEDVLDVFLFLLLEEALERGVAG